MISLHGFQRSPSVLFNAASQLFFSAIRVVMHCSLGRDQKCLTHTVAGWFTANNPRLIKRRSKVNCRPHLPVYHGIYQRGLCTENHTHMPDLHHGAKCSHVQLFGRMVTYVEDIKCSANAARRLFSLAAAETRRTRSRCRCSVFWFLLSEASGFALFQTFDVTGNGFGWHEVMFLNVSAWRSAIFKTKTSGIM